MKKLKLCALALIALIASNSYAGPRFEEAVAEAKLESKEHYIGRLKMLALSLISRMQFLKAQQEANTRVCSAPILLTQNLIHDYTRATYSWAAAALDEIEEELPASPLVTPEQKRKFAKNEFDLLAQYYARVYEALSSLDRKKVGDTWFSFAPNPDRLQF